MDCQQNIPEILCHASSCCRSRESKRKQANGWFGRCFMDHVCMARWVSSFYSATTDLYVCYYWLPWTPFFFFFFPPLPPPDSCALRRCLGGCCRLMAHYDYIVDFLAQPGSVGKDSANLIGQMAKFETLLPNFLLELKALLATEGGKWEWLRHSYIHISTYVRGVNVPPLSFLSPWHTNRPQKKRKTYPPSTVYAFQHLNIPQACYHECRPGSGVVGASKRYLEMGIFTTSLFALAAAGPEKILKVVQDLDDATTSSKEYGAHPNLYTMYVKLLPTTTLCTPHVP